MSLRLADCVSDFLHRSSCSGSGENVARDGLVTLHATSISIMWLATNPSVVHIVEHKKTMGVWVGGLWWAQDVGAS